MLHQSARRDFGGSRLGAETHSASAAQLAIGVAGRPQRANRVLDEALALSRDGVVTSPLNEREDLAPQDCDCGSPRGHGRSAKRALRLGGDEMALDVESVVCPRIPSLSRPRVSGRTVISSGWFELQSGGRREPQPKNLFEFANGRAVQIGRATSRRPSQRPAASANRDENRICRLSRSQSFSIRTTSLTAGPITVKSSRSVSGWTTPQWRRRGRGGKQPSHPAHRTISSPASHRR